MMELRRLDGTEFLLNPLLVETIESTPDTIILLTSGRHYVVQEAAPAARRAWETAVSQLSRGGFGLTHVLERGEHDG